jgi:hypothetical protein
MARFIYSSGFDDDLTVALGNDGAGFQPAFHFGVEFPVRYTGLVWSRAVGAVTG